jgi:hypothetical protein
VLSAAILALSLFLVHPGHAQPYPARPVKIIVPTVAGGTVDVITRLIANDLSSRLGVSFVVDNRSGAGNTLGSREAARSDPDGYTLLMSSASGQVISPLVYRAIDWIRSRALRRSDSWPRVRSSSWSIRRCAGDRSRSWSPTPRPIRESSTMAPPAPERFRT